MISRSITEAGIVADLYHDGSGQPRRTIVMLGGSEGGKVWSSSQINKPRKLLVDMGYTLLSLAYFKARELPSTLEAIPLEYFETAFAWLASQPEVIFDEIGLLGGSKGAEAALLLGSMHPNIKAVVALSPSSVVWEGIPKMGVDLKTYPHRASWSYHGEDLPFVKNTLSSWNISTMISTIFLGTLRKQFEKALENKEDVEKASIPVEKIQGGILLISGRKDAMWPATQMSEQIMSRLMTKGFTYPHSHIAYNTGHQGFIQKKECWRLISDFLKKNYAPS